MTKQFSSLVEKIKPSFTLQMTSRAAELRAQGEDVINFGVGEPDFNTPNYIKNAAINAINENYNSYTPVDGYLDLKKAIITKFERDNNLKYKPSQIVVSTGAKQALYNVCLLYTSPSPRDGFTSRMPSSA